MYSASEKYSKSYPKKKIIPYSNKNKGLFDPYLTEKELDYESNIKKQREEIDYLKSENARLSRLEQSYSYIQTQVENRANEIKANAKYEAELIIREAKDNASAIVNDALLKSQKLIDDRERLNQTLKVYKRKVRNALMEQLEIIEDIEVL